MAESLIYSRFHRSPCCVQNLSHDGISDPIRIVVVKAIELTEAQYQHFTSHMLEDMSFIAANCDLTGCDAKGINRCLLVYDRKRRDGVLVDSQGCSYARYAAYVPDRSQLDLRGVAVDHYNLKIRESRSGRKQQER